MKIIVHGTYNNVLFYNDENAGDVLTVVNWDGALKVGMRMCVDV